MSLLFYKRCDSYGLAAQHANLTIAFIPGAKLININNIEKEDGFEKEIQYYSSVDMKFSVTYDKNKDYTDLYITELN